MGERGGGTRTDLVEEEHYLLVCPARAHEALHLRRAAGERVARVQHLDDDVRSVHNLDKLLVEGAARAVGVWWSVSSRAVHSKQPADAHLLPE
jgi:hypothetical protein